MLCSTECFSLRGLKGNLELHFHKVERTKKRNRVLSVGRAPQTRSYITHNAVTSIHLTLHVWSTPTFPTPWPQFVSNALWKKIVGSEPKKRHFIFTLLTPRIYNKDTEKMCNALSNEDIRISRNDNPCFLRLSYFLLMSKLAIKMDGLTFKVGKNTTWMF